MLQQGGGQKLSFSPHMGTVCEVPGFLVSPTGILLDMVNTLSKYSRTQTGTSTLQSL